MKRHAPAAARNAQPILEQLRALLPKHGRVLEVASGSGQHAALFAAALAPLEWQPSDVNASALESIAAYRQAAGLDNLLEPLSLDVSTASATQHQELGGIVCINMIHISPWAATEGLFAAAGAWLGEQAPLISYGPYRFAGRFTSLSNETFDAGLRHQDARWGLRDVDDLNDLATRAGLAHAQVIEMPANNHLLVFRKR